MEGLLNSIISGKILSSFQQTIRISKGCPIKLNKNAGKDVKSCELVQPFKRLQKVMNFKQMLWAKNIKSIKKFYEHQTFQYKIQQGKRYQIVKTNRNFDGKREALNNQDY
ncbi:unnamed protein product [Paramecium primaurelia]|uniref:Uncharacterized protein n=1 Tax=Paramecium primaurelia TaxID=5886 RepID=A0A8S1MLF3_PARPR|nr:unnamed protein product [Paramecium primaurelia]CAD8081274.1 unnamed protein product [Paramecium primaurelia]CAD8081280.1 unnamed protein product [Paramecium primaurelia]